MSETREHKDAVAWFRGKYPEHSSSIRVSLMGLNFGSGAKAARMMNHIKSMGGVVGESDIAISIPKGGFGSLILEHKGAGQPHKLSDKQELYLDYHEGIGNCAVSTRGLEAFKAAIEDYMGL